MENESKNKAGNTDSGTKKLLLSDVSISKLPDDVMSFLNELDDFTDPYDANYIGSRMSNRLNDILEKYS
jgi:hypothetical protein